MEVGYNLEEMRHRRDHSNIKDIVKRIRKFDRLNLLANISRIAAKLDNEPGRSKRLTRIDRVGPFEYPRHIYVSSHGLASLTRLVLAHGNEWARGPSSTDDIILLENQVSNLPSYFTTDEQGELRPEHLFFQLAKQQFQFQTGGGNYDLGRSIILFKDIPKILRSEDVPAPDLEGIFMQITGMSIGQFMWAGFLVWARCKNGVAVPLATFNDLIENINDKWQGPENERPTLDSIRGFLEFVSLDFAGFAAQMGDLRLQDERSIAVDFQPLLEFPIVRTPGDEYIVPIPKLLFDRFTNGLFHDFARGMPGSGQGNQFRTYFGQLLERYVGLQLAMVFDSELLFSERNYGKDGKSTPDWVVNDPGQPLAIECRSSTFTLETQKNPDVERISRDLGRIGTDTLVEIQAKIQALQQGQTHISLASDRSPLPILCTFESLEPLGMFGAFLRREVHDSTGIEPPNFYLMPLYYLEAMCAGENRDSFFRALKELEVDEKWYDMSVEGQRQRWSRTLPDPMPRNRILDEAAEEFWAAYLWPSADRAT